jgi:hypothetical protein
MRGRAVAARRGRDSYGGLEEGGMGAADSCSSTDEEGNSRRRRCTSQVRCRERREEIGSR